MRYEEARLAAAVEELKTFSAKITDADALADLEIIIAGFQTMRPYVGVGLKVCPSSETLEAITRLSDNGLLTQDLRNTLAHAVDVARRRDVPAPAPQTITTPCRPASRTRTLKRSVSLGAPRRNRVF